VGFEPERGRRDLAPEDSNDTRLSAVEKRERCYQNVTRSAVTERRETKAQCNVAFSTGVVGWVMDLSQSRG
jgi:hypothetical protein